MPFVLFWSSLQKPVISFIVRVAVIWTALEVEEGRLGFYTNAPPLSMRDLSTR